MELNKCVFYCKFSPQHLLRSSSLPVPHTIVPLHFLCLISSCFFLSFVPYHSFSSFLLVHYNPFFYFPCLIPFITFHSLDSYLLSFFRFPWPDNSFSMPVAYIILSIFYHANFLLYTK